MSATAPRWGWTDEQLATAPTVYAPELFAGKTVLVSGAGTGIGKGIAFLLARLGADLVLCGRRAELLEQTRQGLQRFGGQVLTLPLNIREPERVAEAMDRVWETFGKLDVLVNNAGGQFPRPAIDLTVNGWNAVIDTNLNGTWTMMQSAARYWRDHGQSGNIVNIVLVVERGTPGAAHTGAARAGVIALSKTVAVEWAPLGIRVNCIAPGTIETDAFRYYPPEASANFHLSNPMKHTGDVQDIAEAVAYLAAPSGKFITGEVLAVDGGLRMWGECWVTAKPDYFKV